MVPMSPLYLPPSFRCDIFYLLFFSSLFESQRVLSERMRRRAAACVDGERRRVRRRNILSRTYITGGAGRGPCY